MNAVLAGLLVYVLTACAVSALLFLPAAAVMEWLPRSKPQWASLAWFLALGLPHPLAAMAVVYSARLHAIDPVPWLIRQDRIRHLSFWWIVESPDAAYRVHVAAGVAVALVAAGLLRPVVASAMAWRHSRLLARVSAPVLELGIWLTPLERPWSACVGFLRGRVYVTQGLVQLLDPAELGTVIAHEQAHAGRRDNLRLLLAQALMGPTVAMPTAHYYHRRLRVSIERAADQAAAADPADQELLASALVKAARRLRDFHPATEEEALRGRMASRFREDFVAERAWELLDQPEGHEGDTEGRADVLRLTARRAGPLVATALLIGLAVAVGTAVKPTIRSLFESLLSALEHGR